jgi:transposase
VIRETYVRLMAKNKERKVALIACARKLLVILTAMVRNDETWDPTRNQASPPPLPQTEVQELTEALAALGIEPEDDQSIEPEATNEVASASAPSKPTTRKANPRKQKASVKTTAKPTASRKRRPASELPMAT